MISKQLHSYVNIWQDFVLRLQFTWKCPKCSYKINQGPRYSCQKFLSVISFLWHDYIINIESLSGKPGYSQVKGNCWITGNSKEGLYLDIVTQKFVSSIIRHRHLSTLWVQSTDLDYLNHVQIAEQTIDRHW